MPRPLAVRVLSVPSIATGSEPGERRYRDCDWVHVLVATCRFGSRLDLYLVERQ